MSFVSLQDGTQSASLRAHSAAEFASERVNVNSLADLLTRLNSQTTSQTPMLRTTAGKVAAFLGKPIDEISLDLVYARQEGFRPFLESQRHKEGAIRSYVNYLRILLQAAEGLGWKPFARLSVEWQSVLDLAKKNGCLGLSKFLAQTKQTPEDVTQEDFERWINLKVKQGTRYVTTTKQVSAAWHTLVACGFDKNAPIAVLRKKRYGVPFSELPVLLREEVTELLRWKSSEFEPGRPRRAQIRKISAKSLQQTFCSVYGYATKISNRSGIASLEQLLQEAVVAGFISWCLNEQKLKGGPLAARLARVSVVLQHPAHNKLDLSWLKQLLETIPADSDEEIKARKAKKYLDYDVLEAIPAKVNARRIAEAKKGIEHVARLAMEELMMSCLLVFPWRQRNLRECRIGGENPNLFKARVPEFSYIEKPTWAQQAEAENPNAEFWQIKFSHQETKTGVSVHALLPRHLVGLLEEYLSEYRPILMNGGGSDKVFLTSEGVDMQTPFVTQLVSDLTLRYGGRRVTPHLFRDIVAFAWLKAHPQDYLTLSKMLWHKNVATTINYYASRFNVSSSTVAMESWLEERQKKS